ncbi:hypothetical protein ASPZODRAFT_136602 [Penicilliopsis zonata CBS 506.65]|uniref:Copper transport protein n=1 Tax=Penicilliopsis zonata CBS 506.65 TaxID=1073090 RepID=A0A1L9S7C8_9EURO|nr:hypothetical protein ASPZODRAFT_136602 [Penicilliopsis zonata CBS 506.65]OJJ43060.1 hypothetical protein ASPZODRAFT_136602 [Penicilliopsis zonata CBS 506.65]
MNTTSSSTPMFFRNDKRTTLYLAGWTPFSDGTYFLICSFLIGFAFITRALVAFRAVMEQRFRTKHLDRQRAAADDETSDTKEKKNKTIPFDLERGPGNQQTSTGVMAPPWRLIWDVPRALLFALIATCSYLLIIAVMTMNVGYFCSVITGLFLGELTYGRSIQWARY